MSTVKTKILIITVRADHGGGPRHIYLLLRNLFQDFEFYIACPKEDPYYGIFSEIVQKERIFTIPHRKFTIKDYLKLKQIVKVLDINIIHSHGKGAGIYSRLLTRSTKIPSIHTFHGIHIGSYNHLSKSLYLRIERYLSRFTNKFITISDSEKNKIVSLRIVKKDNIVLIPNGVEITESKVNTDVFSKEKLNLVTITRFDYQKNSELIAEICTHIKSYGLLNKFQIQLIGDGPEFSKVKALAEQNGLSGSLKFIGFTPSPSEYLIDSFCYISTSRWEGLPLGVMEAMSLGVPVIATNVSGNCDLVEHLVNGFLFDLNKPEEAAKYIIQLADNKEQWKQFSENARAKIIKSYSEQIMAEKTKQLYSSFWE